MSESRDANDPRDELRALRNEARAEFEREQANDTGGQEHASQADREGVPASRREPGERTGSTRSIGEQPSEGAPRAPRGDPASGGGKEAGGAPPEYGETDPSGE